VYQALLAQLQTQAHSEQIVVRSARPFLLGALAQDWRGAIVYITARGRRAYNVTEQLTVWLGDERRIYRFAEPTPMFYDRLAWDRVVIRDRLQTLSLLQHADTHNTQPIVITSARALIQRTLSPQQVRQNSLTIRKGDRYATDKLIQFLLSVGYESTTMCVEGGTFTRRGGILDVFPIDAPQPFRIDFFDDEIDTLKIFDPSTQRSKDSVTQLTIMPAREVLPSAMPTVAKFLEAQFKGRMDEDGQPLGTSQDLDALANGIAFPFLEHYMPFVNTNPVTLLDHMPENALILLEDSQEVENRIDELVTNAEQNRQNNVATRQITPDHPTPFATWQVVEHDLRLRRVLRLGNNPNEDGEQNRLFAPQRRYSGQLRPLINRAQEALKQNQTVVIVSAQIERITGVWSEQTAQEFVPKLTDITDTPPPIAFIQGELSEGWELRAPDAHLHLITDGEIFNWQRPEPRRRKNESKGRKQLPESDYADWKQGEYVVHVDYGIGQFLGLQGRYVEGSEREYLVIQYDGNDVVFVPIHQADRLTRYVGADDKAPTLTNISKPIDWLKAKEKARRAAEEEAKELLEIYAKRANAQGYAFRPDTVYQNDMEANFPYVETEDQVRVIKEVKSDMEKHMPMDRLVCGDVGYGKTEVAIRATFKAVMDGKQVAVLVPTTVLADQHYHTFLRRMESFGVVVELMSRFRTKGEQNEILTRLANGKVDIIVGTHRLLSDDIVLPNLGLMIIDEEQRFGVKHKEHFKKFRANVDVLTLTATPIPRTLYMSMSGVRDISMIQTPPEERLPIITHVGAFNNKLARQAILRELDRGGQVFIIHNRIKTIENTREKFEELVPEASIVVGHGQMSGKQLESVISEFSRGQYDILLATSIIENGIDMPNVNTLIVDRAEWFGLSQLYQIRGRVGRGAQQAYAYFFHAKGALNEDARMRLETLSEYTDLGVGFQIAVRDLEMRGAGDILSMKQSGHVTIVGLQLYTQLLQHAVSQLKAEQHGTAPEPEPLYAQQQVVIDLPLAAYIPESWIPEMALRLQLYRRIGNLQTVNDIEQLRAELRDRFGELPKAVEGLLYQIHVKLLATEIRATAVVKPREHILIRLSWLQAIERPKLARQLGADVEVSRTAVELRPTPETWRTRLIELLEFLKRGLPEQVGL
jgi:transcription-repair coupling factor (superfamily II helicase)